jgi:hypothetical protein
MRDVLNHQWPGLETDAAVGWALNQLEEEGWLERGYVATEIAARIKR